MAYKQINDLKAPLQAYFAKVCKLPLKACIYAEQTTPLVTPCVVYKIRSHETLGAPTLIQELGNKASPTDIPNWQDIHNTYQQAISFIVSINIYGKHALDLATAIAASSFRKNLTAELRSKGISFFSTTSIKDLTALVNARYQSRFQLDAHFTAELLYTEKVEQMRSVQYALSSKTTTTKGDTIEHTNREHS